MTLPTLNHHSDESLLSSVRELRGNENSTIAKIVLHLHEIDTRQIYRDAGYPSLFAYCTQCLGYSDSSAGRRIEAARALRGSPEIYQLIRDGKISLCAVGTVARVLTPENRTEILTLSQGRTRLQVERLAAQYRPVEAKPRKRETIRVYRRPAEAAAPGLFTQAEAAPKVEERFSVTFELTAEEMKLVEQARALVGNCQVKDVVLKSMKEFVARRNPKPRTVKPKKLPTPTLGAILKTPVRSRYVARAVRREVRERDGDRCTFVSSDGTRCSECRGLELDHLTPFAHGGSNTAENLRLVCRSHNALYAERIFGREKIRGFAAQRRESP